MRKNLATVALLAAILASLPSAGSAASGRLFRAVPAPVVPRAVEADRAQRSRVLDFDRTVLPSEPDFAPGFEARRRVVLDLFDDVSLEARFDRIDRTAGGFVLLGGIVGEPNSVASLSVWGASLVGDVTVNGRMYAIRDQDGRCVVAEIDAERMPADEPETYARHRIAAPSSAGEGGVPPTNDKGKVLDLLVAYTPAARAAMGSTGAMEAHIADAISRSNAAYDASGVSTRLNLVGSHEVTYTEDTTGAGAFDNALLAVTSTSDGIMDEVHALRDSKRADLVALLINDAQYCGLAWLQDTPSVGFAVNAFSVTAAGSCATSNYSFPHEIGHNLGSRHDAYVDAGGTPWPYSHGYTYLGGTAPASWRTIMAYSNECVAIYGSGCTRLGYFSNPDVAYGGIAMGNAGTANNALSLNNVVPTAAQFRNSGIDPPCDFNGDRISEVVVYSSGAWHVYRYSDGVRTSSLWTGNLGSRPLMMDYDGDGRDELTIFSGYSWHFFDDAGSYVKGIWIGQSSGIPVPADYDGDGDDDVVVYDNGSWLHFDYASGAFSSVNSRWTGSVTGARPAPADYDGDGTADMAVYSTTGAWHFYNANGSYKKGIWVGAANGLPVPADYDGDRVADVVCFVSGAWRAYDYATGAYNAGRSVWTGLPAHATGGTSTPTPIDYDGDGAVDLGIYAGGPWHFYADSGAYGKGIWTGAVAGNKGLSGKPEN